MFLKLALFFVCSVLTVRSQDIFFCDFEQDICTFEQDRGDSPKQNSPTGTFDWERLSGQTNTANTGPDGGQGGSTFYIYIETSDPQRSADTASIYTQQLGITGDVCVDFWYNMYGPTIGELRLFIQRASDRNNRNIIWRETGDKGQAWLRQRQTVTLPTTDSRIGFTGVKGNDYQSDIALDTIRMTRGSCSDPVGPGQALPFRCDFENGELCSMQQRTDDQFDWTRQQGCTSSPDTGPCNAQSGTWYMYIEASEPRVNGDRAVLQSPQFSTTGNACVRFWYHMYGNTIGSLSVFTQSRGQGSPWRTIAGNQGNMWIQANVEITLTAGDRVGFIGVRGGDSQGDIAIDSVDIFSGDCGGSVEPTAPPTAPPGQTDGIPYFCNFEANICSMIQRTDDQFDWERRTGTTDTTDTGPDRASEGSWYIYIEASSPRVPNDRAKISTASLNYNGDVCVAFYYNMNGMDINRLYVWTTNRGENAPIFDMTGNKGSQWTLANVDVNIRSGEQIVFVGVRGPDIRGDIALDDLRITAGRCNQGQQPTTTTTTSRPTISDFFSCNIESDGTNDQSCRLRQDRGDTFDWTRNQGMTPSGAAFQRRIEEQRYAVTGPDNAQEGTFYLYIEASNRNDRDVARIIIEGESTRRGGDNCLRFYYNMNGFHIGTLIVYTTFNNERVPRWTLTGDQQIGWRRASVLINLDGVTEVGFEARTDGFFNGDMAIDNIQITQGQCESTPSEYVWWCNFELSDGSSTLCNMAQDLRDSSNYDWILWRDSTPSLFTGPTRAYNGNFYIFLEASAPRQQGEQARILLPRLNRSGDHCLEFRYHMYGFHMGTLQVYTRRGTTETGNRWTLQGDQGDQWRDGRVTIESLINDEEIGFRGVRGTEYSGDMAVDNIRLRSGRC